jgi:hypothetical protein
MIDNAGNSVVPNIPVGFVPFAAGQHLYDAANAGLRSQVKLDHKRARPTPAATTTR